MTHAGLIFVIDDSLTALKTVEQILHTHEYSNIMQFTSPLDALKALKDHNPMLVIVDIMMEEMDGFEFVSIMNRQHQIPAVIMSAFYREQDKLKTMRAYEVGALSILEKPLGVDEHAHKLASELIAVVQAVEQQGPTEKIKDVQPITVRKGSKYEIVAIGASLGGPVALQKLLTALPESFVLPIIIVQHINAGFDDAFAKWLNQCTTHSVTLAKERDKIEAGCIYIAPADYHLLISDKKTMKLDKSPPVNSLRPSIDTFFQSLAPIYQEHVIGVLLTGMGSDGVIGLKELKAQGARTIAQAEEGCSLFGMPKVAIEEQAVTDIIPIHQLAFELTKMAEL